MQNKTPPSNKLLVNQIAKNAPGFVADLANSNIFGRRTNLTEGEWEGIWSDIMVMWAEKLDEAE